MKPLGLSSNGLSKALGIPQNRVSEIVRGRRGMGRKGTLGSTDSGCNVHDTR